MGLFSRKKKEEFVSPMTGTLLPIEQCPDPVFAGKIMGDGLRSTDRSRGNRACERNHCHRISYRTCIWHQHR